MSPRSNLDGKTLGEKRYGDGYRDDPLVFRVTTFDRCFYDECFSPVLGTTEIYVDDTPPGIDSYTRMLQRIPLRSWATIPLCAGHGEEVMRRSLDALDDPDTWAPGRTNPFVFPHPMKLIRARGIVTA